MRRIDKICEISGYQEWYDENPNRIYSSSNGKYYYQIVQNLFHCQRGVCAFTERRLCSDRQYANFPTSILASEIKFDGNVEHFDSDLKKLNGWAWENLFMAHSDTNRRKSTFKIDYILKPDEHVYDPFFLMKYSVKNHLFFANTENLNESEQKRVNDMIELLGINFDSVVDDREKFFLREIDKVKFGLGSWSDFEPHVDRFYTAFEMIKRRETIK